jgi:glycosyltransferase involved in cell wall biosynthesis
MRVLLITDWTAHEGGIETYVRRASHGLQSAGHQVRLLTSSIASAGREAADYVAFGTDNPAAQSFLQIANPFALARVRQALRDFQPNVVQVNMFEKYLSPLIFQALRGIPTVVLVHYSKPICPTALKLLPDGTICQAPAGLICWRSGCVGGAEWLRDRPRYALFRSGLAQAAKVLACSRWMTEQLRLNRIAAEPIPLPVPLPQPGFRRAPSRDPLFLYCGRLNWEKGIDLLLHAFAQVQGSRPGARLRIIGGGPRQPMLERLAERLGIRHAVRFDGRTPFAEVEVALSEAWALVAPSLWPEPLGLSAIEAIARGVPAIASAAGGFAETIDPGVSGFLVPNGDQRALTERLIQAVDEGPLRLPDEVVCEMQARHHPGRHTELLEGVFRDAIDKRAGHHS